MSKLSGIEILEGTYPFDLERSARGYRLNKFLHALIKPDHRTQFLATPQASFEAAELSAEEQDLIRRLHWCTPIDGSILLLA